MIPKALLWLALMFVPAVLVAQVQVAIDSAPARQLVEMWRRQPGDSLACVTARIEEDTIIAIETVTLAPRCDGIGAGTVGQFGFIVDEHSADSDAVLAAMTAVLMARPDLLLSGEIYGAVPVPAYGRILWAPRAWWAIRRLRPARKAAS